MRRWGSLALGAIVACATPGDVERVPLCAPLDSLQPLPAAACELGDFPARLSESIVPRSSQALVRVELDAAAAIRAICVEKGPGYSSSISRREIAEHFDAIRALPSGPACAAGRRLDLNRYEARWSEVRDREARCQEQTRVTRETHGDTTLRNATVRGHYGVYDREFERCMEYDANWIRLDAPGSPRPWIYVKAEIPNPPGPSAHDTAGRCLRKSRVFEKRAACIESEGWERLEPPPQR